MTSLDITRHGEARMSQRGFRRSNLDVLLAYATEMGGDRLMLRAQDGENPARWRGHLQHLLPARSDVQRVRHHPALPWQKMPEFMPDLRDRHGVSARVLTAAE